jgi:hypothetical protein
VGLELAHVVPDRRVAFYWIGGRGHALLGSWEVGTAPQRLSLHLAFRATKTGKRTIRRSGPWLSPGIAKSLHWWSEGILGMVAS